MNWIKNFWSNHSVKVLWLLVFASLAWNYKTHKDQQVVGSDVATAMERTTPMIGWKERYGWSYEMPVGDVVGDLQRRLLRLERNYAKGQYRRQVVTRNLDELAELAKTSDQLARVVRLANTLDNDDDGVGNVDDICPFLAAIEDEDNTRYPGCPINGDYDDLYDYEDICPNEAGAGSAIGCPFDTDLSEEPLQMIVWNQIVSVGEMTEEGVVYSMHSEVLNLDWQMRCQVTGKDGEQVKSVDQVVNLMECYELPSEG